MIFSTYYDGKLVSLPLDFEFARPVRGRLSNHVALTIDERDFDRLFGEQAEWIHGKGPYATLAYCRLLTIQRHKSVEDAINAKRAIDGGGCGGGCARVHLIIHCDPTNSEHEAEQQRIREHIASQEPIAK